MWQDVVFLAGSVFSILVLAPTLKNSMAHVPLGTSLPSSALGVVYGATFFSMGMTFSAGGSLLTGLLWGLIAMLRSPGLSEVRTEHPEQTSSRQASGQYAD